MKLAFTLLVALTACSGIQPKKESPLVKEGSDVPADCCCKTTPLSNDDKPVFAMTGRLECSTQQGECVGDPQCQREAAGSAQ
ncbi:MAG TPA: hypothetical protein VFP84_03335 [Kofleriaceae bacterium]|nr:hypothetical protein [Kofleriaceae bacterium]